MLLSLAVPCSPISFRWSGATVDIRAPERPFSIAALDQSLQLRVQGNSARRLIVKQLTKTARTLYQKYLLDFAGEVTRLPASVGMNGHRNPSCPNQHPTLPTPRHLNNFEVQYSELLNELRLSGCGIREGRAVPGAINPLVLVE